MDFKGLLNQVMASGGDLAQQAKTSMGQSSSSGGSGMSDMTKGAIGGAVGGSLLTMLVGSKKGRKMGKKAAKLGGAAALGALAFKVFNDWQSNQQPQSQSASTPEAVPSQPTAALPPQTEQHSMVVLKAMIAAAKSDGHVDDDEKSRIFQAVQAIGASADVSAFVQQELDKPLDPVEIAAAVGSPQEASEVYLASVLMVDEQNFMEQAYLKELAKQLQLPPELVAQLEAQVA
ncbi:MULTISPECIES: tellurite resistance TerB family protein [Ferrimonas]|uniref:tellurite resistance TerB family protein n=1 Tax=Ferrimonas TaxID=44011 RepID=UPI00042889E8|nr:MULTISPECIES: tellurite resistance TerB family protein [Ferrimonas]USD36625.1 tellurite resistance TerB family protein [Ferrimonas sp. SCSIO 43195]